MNMKSRLNYISILIPLFTSAILSGCGDVDSEEEPLRVGFVPSVEMGEIELELDEFDSKLSELLDMPVESDIVLSYTACIEQMAAGHFDIAFLPPLAYVLANDRYDIEAILNAVRDGKSTYRGEIITHIDSGIDSIQDLRGRTFGFTDASSASGHLYPKTFLISNGIDPDIDLAGYDFQGSHPAVVQSVLQGRVDAGACFDDARLRLIDTEPTVMEQTKVIAYTPEIPGDTVSIRTGLDEDLVQKITEALIELSREGESGPLFTIYEIDELVPVDDSAFDPIRQMVQTLNYDIESELE